MLLQGRRSGLRGRLHSFPPSWPSTRLPARNPEESPLYKVVAGHLETFLARQRERDKHVPAFAELEFRSFLDCGVLVRGSVIPH
jgi:hypothetical protein